MRPRLAVIPALCLALATLAAAQDDVLTRALKDELDRSMKQLQLEKLEKPYFIAYRAMAVEGRSVSARFGAIVGSGENRLRTLRVEIRVGDYKLDNTNFLLPSAGPSGGGAVLPLEDDYKEMRRQIWLATDAAYKRALEDLARKRSALQNKTRTEEIPDFSQEPASSVNDEIAPAQHSAAQLEGLARRLSALFREMPDVNSGAVSITVYNQRTWYVDSEGRVAKTLRPSVVFNTRAATQAADGTPLEESFYVHRRAFAELPDEKELAARMREIGEHLKALRTAGSIDTYNGPVLFEGQAAADLFERAFAPNLLATRRPISENPNMAARDNPFIDKIGARVLPESISVVDNPALAELNGQPLQGGIKVDDEGVPAQEVKLVEKGYLRTLLSTRVPVRRINQSNGHFRSSGPAPTNLVVTAEDGIPAAELREKFLGMLKAQGKDYGIIVRRLGGGVQGGIGLLLASKITPDGKEELIRGVEVSGLVANNFKEILAASKEQTVYTVPFRGGPPQTSAGGFPSDRVASFAVPSLLFEDLTVKKISRELPKPPAAQHPYFDR